MIYDEVVNELGIDPEEIMARPAWEMPTNPVPEQRDAEDDE